MSIQINLLQYYRTIVIDPYQVLIDSKGYLHPDAGKVLRIISSNNYYIIFSSVKGQHYCRTVAENFDIPIIIETKNSKYLSKIAFFNLSTQTSLGMYYKAWSILPPYEHHLSTNTSYLNDAIDDYISMIQSIEYKLNKNKMGFYKVYHSE